MGRAGKEGAEKLFAPVAFGFGGQEYQVRLGLEQVAEIERQMGAGIFSVRHQLEQGFLSAVVTVASIVLRRKSEVGFTSIDLGDIGPVINDPAGAYVSALYEALGNLGNGLGLVKPSPPH